MSNTVYVITFNRGEIHLEMRFEGDEYQTAVVQMELKSNDPRQVMAEVVRIPVKNLMDAGYLIGMCLRRAAAQYELEVQEMLDGIEQKKHPLKIKGEENEKDKKEKK